jgi:hypothetical protein
MVMSAPRFSVVVRLLCIDYLPELFIRNNVR